MRSGRRYLEFLGGINWDATFAWGLGFGLIVLLGLDGGGYDALVYSQVGIAVWWILLLSVLVRALPRSRLSKVALLALGLFAAFAVWTALSLIWTESAERTTADLARVLTYLGIFSLALFLRVSREARRLIAAVAAAIVLLAVLGLLSRLHPAWFPSANQTGRLLVDSRERLSYPLNYWNGLAALIAIGMPLVLHVASSAKTTLVRSLSAAALPAMSLAIFFTLSRGGVAAAAVSLALFFALTGDRLPRLMTLIAAAGGSAVLIALTASRNPLQEGLTNSIARHQGDEILLICLAICACVGLIQAGITVALRGERRPRWTSPSRNASLAVLGACAVALVAIAAAADAPRHVSSAIDEFKGGGNAGAGTARLNSFAGESRYALWKSAVAENATARFTGTGSGTFEFWWDRDAGGEESVHDAHSLYLQTLGELGVIGLLLLGGFLLVILGTGIRAAVRAGPDRRPQLAAAIAACVGFCFSAAIDWTWQIPVLPTTLLLLGSILVAGGSTVGVVERLRLLPLRIALAVGAAVAIVAIAVPFASTDLVRQSEAEARSGDLGAALADAHSAQNAQADAATPRLQQALVLELRGELEAAAEAAQGATERESTNWRIWLVLSRIEAERGRAVPSLRAYRKAKSLKPLSPLFDR